MFCNIPQGRNELARWNLASAWTKKVQRILRKRNFAFWYFLTPFLFVFLKKKKKKFNEIENNSKFRFLEIFWPSFSMLACSFLPWVISQNIILNKSHFCKKSIFCQNLSNVDQHFQKILSSRFSCDYIHGLPLRDNFGAFNINIKDYMGKNSEKITKNFPSVSYKRVKTPIIRLVISSEPSWILTFGKKRLNHSNKFSKISLTCFLTPDPPYRLLMYLCNRNFCIDLNLGEMMSLRHIKLFRRINLILT